MPPMWRPYGLRGNSGKGAAIIFNSAGGKITIFLNLERQWNPISKKDKSRRNLVRSMLYVKMKNSEGINLLFLGLD